MRRAVFVMRSKPWYLSGPMTGYADLNFPAFRDTAAAFRAQGVPILNPIDLCPPDCDWETAMAIDLAAMRQAAGVLLLPGWELSRGARLEWAWARALGLPRLPVHVGWMLLVGRRMPMSPPWEVTKENVWYCSMRCGAAAVESSLGDNNYRVSGQIVRKDEEDGAMVSAHHDVL